MFIINDVDSVGDGPNEFVYSVKGATGQEVSGPLKRGHYKVIQPQGPPPYTVILYASPRADVAGIQSPDVCITYYKSAPGHVLVTTESR
jgi:hypothetical protein